MADRPKVVAIVVTAALAITAGGPALASSWVDPLAGGSTAEATAGALPPPPATVGAACLSPTASIITVAWTGVGRATSYSVFDTTTSATGTYNQVATGITGTSWSSGKLATGNYWFEVRDAVGANWIGALSVPSVETTVVRNKSCVQP